MSATDFKAAATMDRIYRHQRRIYDVTRKYYLLGRDKLLSGLEPQPGQSVLEIGCGTGRNLVAVSRLYPRALIHGFDISGEMLETAAAAVERTGKAIRLAQADATRFSPKAVFNRNGFDRVFISYTLSMIPDWRAALAAAASSLNDGGQLHIVDFGQQSDLPGWFRRALYRWLALFHVHPDPDLQSTLEQLAHAHGLTIEIAHSFRGYAIFAVLSKP
jgi:S-adenosylmethionine-diacylgycerolhomoserine-N-methlytransferase